MRDKRLYFDVGMPCDVLPISFPVCCRDDKGVFCKSVFFFHFVYFLRVRDSNKLPK